ncbi:MAG: SGNH/GDSL hydrolase family protein [Kovacikia sp.]
MNRNPLLTRISVYLNVALLTVILTFVLQTGLFEQWLSSFQMTATISPLTATAAQPKPDPVLAMPWWQDEIQYRVRITQNQRYDHCLFGDSITSGLGNTFGDRTFNFALSGMSSVSLVEQLSRLVASNVKCDRAIIAIGTNDADYVISNDQFVRSMKQTIALTQQLQASRITLLPAFYSTTAASQNIDLAGPLERVEEINSLLRQVASSENVRMTGQELQALYNGQTLRNNLTLDGVHLNAAGRVIYRNALLQLMQG